MAIYAFAEPIVANMIDLAPKSLQMHCGNDNGHTREKPVDFVEFLPQKIEIN